MHSNQLSGDEIQLLLDSYQSELRRLQYKSRKAEENIAELQLMRRDLLTGTQAVPATPVASLETPVTATIAPITTVEEPPVHVETKHEDVQVTAPEVSEEETEAVEESEVHKSRKGVNPAILEASGETVPQGYKLSEWDTFLLEMLEDENRLMINHELLELAFKRAKALGSTLSDKQIKGKVTRSLNKLVNKRGYIMKAKYQGKGHAYGLAQWFFKNGNVKQEWAKTK